MSMITNAKGKRKKNSFISRLNPGLVFWGIIIFRISLDIVYPLIICKQYGNYGFEYSPDIFRYLVSYISLVVITAYIIPSFSIDKPGSVLFLSLYLMAYVPNMALFSGMSLSYQYYFMSNLYWFMLAFFYKNKFKVWNNSINLIGSNNYLRCNGRYKIIKQYWVFIIAFIAVLLYSMYFNKGLKLTINLKDALDLRLSSRGNISSIFDRILPWSANIIFPMGLIIGVKRKRIGLVILMVLGEVAAFSINGVKTWLFVAFLSMVLSIFTKNEKSIAILPLLLAAICIFGLLFNGSEVVSNFVNNYITRRVFFTTSINNHYWIDFFNNHPKLFFTNSSLGWIRRFVDVPYSTNVSSIIGLNYYGSAANNAASGTIATAYANLGWAGLVFYPIIVSIIAKLLDKASVIGGLDNKTCSIVYIYPIIISSAEYLLNGSIYTAVITYGFLVGVIILRYLIRVGVFEPEAGL